VLAGVPGSVNATGGRIFAGRPLLRFTGGKSTSGVFSYVNDAIESGGTEAPGVASVREMVSGSGFGSIIVGIGVDSFFASICSSFASSTKCKNL